MRFLLKPFSWLWHHKRISAGIIILAVLVFIFYPRPKPIVPTQQITRGTFVQSLSVSGDVVANNSVNLTFPISGKLSWVGVKTGNTVAAGQTIATIDQQTALKNLKAALINYSLQRNTFDQTIHNNNGIADPIQALNYSMQVMLQNNQYNLDQTVNSVELQDLAAKQAVLSTPIAGIITRADTEVPGTDAIAGSTTFTVTDPTSVKFEAEVDQADIGKVQSGMPVNIVFDAYPNETVNQPITKIDFVYHTTSSGGNAFNVETNLPTNTSYKYRVGMNGNADIILSQKENVLSIPLSSLDADNNAWVKTKNGFVKHKITIGQENDTNAEVLSGVTDGDNIALDPTAASAQPAK